LEGTGALQREYDRPNCGYRLLELRGSNARAH
jgi:hypothetical protein